VAARLIVALLLLSGCAATRTPTGVVERFYAERIDSKMTGAPTPAELASVAPYLTPELRGLLADANTLREREAAAAPDEKPPFADGDLFSSLFEGPTTFQVTKDEPKENGHLVTVRFTYETVTWEDVVVVAPADGGWAIADIEYLGDWDFAPRGTLRSNLEHALGRTPAGCPSPVPSQWIVMGHTAPGISAMSDAEADRWNGAVLTLGRHRMKFRDDACTRATFATRAMKPEEFAANFRVSPDALGLAPGPVCVTQVSCGDGVPRPGSTLVHGRDGLLLLWDGVWFRTARR